MSASSTDPTSSAPGRFPGRFFDSETPAAHAVTVRLEPEALLILDEAGAERARWERRRIRGAEEQAPDGTATLRCAGRRGRLVVADPALLSRLSRRRKDLGWAAAGLAALLLLGAAVATGMPVLAALAPLVPRAVQDRLGELALQQGFPRASLCRGAAGQAALNRLARRLAQAGGIGSAVQVEVRDDPLANAFALPASRVVVMRGLVSRMDDGAEFAGVLGHELGHVRAHDPMAGFLRQNAVSVLSMLAGLGGQAVAGTVLNLSYSRAAEARADAASLQMLQAAGMRSDGLGRALQALGGPHQAMTMPWLADHPSTDARVRATVGSPAGAAPLSGQEWLAIRSICAGP